MRKFKTAYKLMLAIGLPAGILGPMIADSMDNNENISTVDNSSFLKYHDDFNVTRNGDILRLPLDENPIPVILDNLEDEAKQYVVDGINSLDNISTKINYTIFDSSDYDKDFGLDYIRISLVEDIEDYGVSPSAAGVTIYNYDEKTAEIKYPISIYLDEHYADGYWDENFTQSILTTITQHELMHTLGFCDLYEEEDKSRSIMYYALRSDSAKTYTNEDIEKIQYCYDGQKMATTTHPNHIKYKVVANLPNNEVKEDDGREL